ncbi:hypothetical protein V8F20_011900 [Naviculisporaceae sp. PSN 640]
MSSASNPFFSLLLYFPFSFLFIPPSIPPLTQCTMTGAGLGEAVVLYAKMKIISAFSALVFCRSSPTEPIHRWILLIISSVSRYKAKGMMFILRR